MLKSCLIAQVSRTHRGSVGYRLPMPCHLPGGCLVPCTYSSKPKMRTFHYYLHVIDQAVDNIKSLGNGRLRLLDGESIEP